MAIVETYRGYRIEHDQDGFCASRASSEHCGYCDTLPEIRQQIDQSEADELTSAESRGEIVHHDDTPSVTPWWLHR